VHKDTVVACVRVEGPKGTRQVETRESAKLCGATCGWGRLKLKAR